MAWLLQFYLHSLRVLHNGVSHGTSPEVAYPKIKPNVISYLPDDLVSVVSYTPPVPHSRPALLQALLTLPPNSTIHLTMDVVKPFLRYTEHPPDAQRGWDLPPAIFMPLSIGHDLPHETAAAENATGASLQLDSQRRLHRVYTPVLLVDLATPDFSMPYNVIIMSCTLIALIFGSVFNLLARKYVIVSLRPPAAPNM